MVYFGDLPAYDNSHIYISGWSFVGTGTKLVRSPDAVRLPDLLTLYRAVLRLEPLADTCTGASTGDGEGKQVLFYFDLD